MLPAGDLQEFVVIEYPVEVRNDLGEATQTWREFAKRWASVQGIGYSEQERRKQVTAQASHIVRVRFVKGITGKMRVRWASSGNRLLFISSVVERGRSEEHELACEEQGV
jgi:SPP1 family predicted phage head-tail adaptor